MAWRVTANPERFDEAMDWFDSRVPIEADDLETLTKSQRDLAFTVAGVNQLNVVTSILDGIAKAVEDGKPIGDFRREMKAKLKGDWTKASSAKLDTIFVTNVQTAYNAGRYTQMTDEDVLAVRPFWVFDAVLDSRTTPICNGLHGTTLPADDPAWSGIYPPLHHRCRSGVRTLSKRAGEKRGVTKDIEKHQRDNLSRRPGETRKAKDIPLPKPGKGFGKTPGEAKPFKPKKSDYPADAWSEYQRKQKALRQ